MEGQKGICMAGGFLRRTKFSTKEHAENALSNTIAIGVTPSSYTVYQCKVCGMWHYGKVEWAKQFGK